MAESNAALLTLATGKMIVSASDASGKEAKTQPAKNYSSTYKSESESSFNGFMKAFLQGGNSSNKSAPAVNSQTSLHTKSLQQSALLAREQNSEIPGNLSQEAPAGSALTGEERRQLREALKKTVDSETEYPAQPVEIDEETAAMAEEAARLILSLMFPARDQETADIEIPELPTVDTFAMLGDALGYRQGGAEESRQGMDLHVLAALDPQTLTNALAMSNASAEMNADATLSALGELLDGMPRQALEQALDKIANQMGLTQESGKTEEWFQVIAQALDVEVLEVTEQPAPVDSIQLLAALTGTVDSLAAMDALTNAQKRPAERFAAEVAQELEAVATVPSENIYVEETQAGLHGGLEAPAPAEAPEMPDVDFDQEYVDIPLDSSAAAETGETIEEIGISDEMIADESTGVDRQINKTEMSEKREIFEASEAEPAQEQPKKESVQAESQIERPKAQIFEQNIPQGAKMSFAASEEFEPAQEAPKQETVVSERISEIIEADEAESMGAPVLNNEKTSASVRDRQESPAAADFSEHIVQDEDANGIENEKLEKKIEENTKESPITETDPDHTEKVENGDPKDQESKQKEYNSNNDREINEASSEVEHEPVRTAAVTDKDSRGQTAATATDMNNKISDQQSDLENQLHLSDSVSVQTGSAQVAENSTGNGNENAQAGSGAVLGKAQTATTLSQTLTATETGSASVGVMTATNTPAQNTGATKAEASMTSMLDQMENIEKLTEAMKLANRGGAKQITLQLSPPELGKVMLRVESRAGVVNAYLRVEKPEAAAQLTDALEHLRENLKAKGVELGELDIRHYNQAAGDQQSGQNRRNRQTEDDAENDGRKMKNISAAAEDEQEQTPAGRRGSGRVDFVA